MIVIIDNHDSFTYNLVQYIGITDPNFAVVMNDEISVSGIIRMNPDKIVISPGPGIPSEAGICLDLIRAMTGECPILGICLGHQAIIEAFGGRLIRSPNICHGKRSMIHCRGSALFIGIPTTLQATRYHSFVAEGETIPGDLRVIAETNDGLIMGIEHVEHPVFGLQFHPESIITEYGLKMIENFLII